MKLKNAAITVIANHDYVRIELHDKTASITFAEVTLTPEQFTKAMSSLAYTPCETNVRGLDLVNKKMEWKNFEFEIPNDWMNEKKNAERIIKDVCPEGWEPSMYFGSQDSFFKKDGKRFARVTIRRWVDIMED